MKPVNLYSEIPRKHGKVKKVQWARLEMHPSGFYVRLRGWRMSRFCGIFHDGERDGEFVEGNLIYEGPVGPTGERVIQDCGAIWTDTDAVGHSCVNGVTYCSPWPLVALQKRTDESLSRWGITLKVVDWLD